ncbi:MAG: 30S ribosomal protein S20 [Elusimicrobia bacterium]|nr:30S ribosomal protein S20 [Elusimicrobiota bacterium]
MAKLKTGRHTGALKEARKNRKRRLVNRQMKDAAKKQIKALEKAISEKSGDVAKLLNSTQSILDKLAKKNIYHKNKISRMKSQISSKLAKNA